ncbi:apolipoprotein N-acyltransferase [Legionella sp. 27cVA30]|uniref:apolipoprotein N-acyltransferase n=1 Tax=Legionella TaxID=445 RepID=UPI000F8F4909|nr:MULTISPECIES: apolipoprotein N-acyltransferase [Legionella]MCP0913316.1 apolipoprotein N-acyltransferase [Legionella sp. 27cVA30]RUR14674.1 apolipoprotein N-acyltransferase [Legionella septentrionalis]
MNQAATATKSSLNHLAVNKLPYLPSFLAGLLLPLGFAPFHLPGFPILGLAFLYTNLQRFTVRQSFSAGFAFGLGFLGLGVSWVYVSIHEYGHLNSFFSALITLLFIIYLAIYPALVAWAFKKLTISSALFSCVLFSALWCLGEYARANIMGGFPWLLLGFGQMDTPLKHLLPVIGVYGISFLTCLAATFLAMGVQSKSKTRYAWILALVSMILLPSSLKHKHWVEIEKTPVSVGVIQANLSMRDKWDEGLFWQLLQHYRDKIEQLLGKNKLIVLPESAIPLPAGYISDILEAIHHQASQKDSAVLLGIPEPTNAEEIQYYNTMRALGSAQGSYLKQHLVPFGEFIPKPFQDIVEWLALPSANLKPGHANQPLIHVHHHPIATLICYELAYPQLLRKQLPKAAWIVSISDDGWFGRSFAMYQQLQMAQALSLQTGRYQVLANNDGLSSLINAKGDIIASLPAFSAGIVEGNIWPAFGSTPWVYLGDAPVLWLSFLLVFFTAGFLYFRKYIQS